MSKRRIFRDTLDNFSGKVRVFPKFSSSKTLPSKEDRDGIVRNKYNAEKSDLQPPSDNDNSKTV